MINYKKISVVLTTYNGKQHIVELLDSIANQTVLPDEVIIADDQSTDNTVNIVKEYIEIHKLENWFVYVNPINLGWQKNFKEAISRATGDYIFLADQDDIWMSKKIEEYINYFEHTFAWLIVSDFKTIGDPKAQKGAYMPELSYEEQNGYKKIKFTSTYYLILRPGCVMAFNNELKDTFLSLWTEGTPHDALIWAIAGAADKIFYIQKPMILFRRESQNASNSIMHNISFKIDEIKRTDNVDRWFLAHYPKSENTRVIKRNLKWCSARYKLLVNKKIVYWFRLILLRDCYYSNKKYFGDLYYYIKAIRSEKK